MTEQHHAVDAILEDFAITNAVEYLEEVENQADYGFSKDPTVNVVGNVELAREKRFLSDAGEK